MYVLGHFGIGLGLAWLLATRQRRPVDYRLVLLGTMLPDFVDKPLGALLGLEARLWTHTLVFLGVVLALSGIPRLRGLVYLAFGVLTHLLLDRIWEQPGIALWPALGVGFPPGTLDVFSLLAVLWTDPLVLAGEIAGAAILVAFARSHGITSWETFLGFLRGSTPRPAPDP